MEIQQNKRIIIGISGKKGSGKDTVAKLINDYVSHKYNFHIAAYADNLKEICSIIIAEPLAVFYDEYKKENHLIPKQFWINGEPTTPRQFLQHIGTELFRDKSGIANIWINSLFATYKGGNLIITDVRFSNEVKAIKERGGIVIRVNRNLSNTDLHKSETELDDFTFDFTIDNNSSLDNLRRNVISICQALKLEKTNQVSLFDTM